MVAAERQIVGVHQFVSAEHLSRYVAEAKWRFNRGFGGEAQRMGAPIADPEGHLIYKALIA